MLIHSDQLNVLKIERKKKKKLCIFWSAMIAQVEKIFSANSEIANLWQSRPEQSRAVQYELKIED